MEEVITNKQGDMICKVIEDPIFHIFSVDSTFHFDRIDETSLLQIERFLNTRNAKRVNGMYGIPVCRTDRGWRIGEESISQIPKDSELLFVDISYTGISEWHRDVAGDFVAEDCPLRTVGEKVRFGANVSVSGCPFLDVWHSPVAGDFYAVGSGLENVSRKASFCRDVSIHYCEDLETWKHDVPGYFNASYSGLRKVTRGATFGGDVNIKECRYLKKWEHNVPGTFSAGPDLKSIARDVNFGGVVCITGDLGKVWNREFEFREMQQEFAFCL